MTAFVSAKVLDMTHIGHIFIDILVNFLPAVSNFVMSHKCCRNDFVSRGGVYVRCTELWSPLTEGLKSKCTHTQWNSSWTHVTIKTGTSFIESVKDKNIFRPSIVLIHLFHFLLVCIIFLCDLV